MAFSEFEQMRYKKIVSQYIDKKKPPAHIRQQLDFSFRLENQSIVIFEIRPRYNDPTEYFENMIAKATFVKTKKIWKIFWLKSDLKWHLYEPQPAVVQLEAFIDVVDHDEHACFFG